MTVLLVRCCILSLIAHLTFSLCLVKLSFSSLKDLQCQPNKILQTAHAALPTHGHRHFLSVLNALSSPLWASIARICLHRLLPLSTFINVSTSFILCNIESYISCVSKISFWISDANGNWMKNNPIPSGYPSWNSFMELRVKSQEDCKSILEELQDKLSNGQDVTEEEGKVSLFYGAGMDEDVIEKVGIEPLGDVLELCKKISTAVDAKEKAMMLGELAKQYSIRPFFAIGSGPDKKNSAWSTAQVYQGGISLPDRDYYFDEDKADKREEYKKFIESLLSLLGGSDNVGELVQKIYKLEESLAEAHMTKTENRDPETTYNKMSIEKLTEMCEGKFDFASYLKGATGKSVEELGEINVRNVKAIQRAASVASEVDAETLEGYLRWKTVCSCAPYLGKEFVQKHFDFYEGVLQGTKEMKPRWKRVMEFTENALGEALGKLYCAKYFDESCKERAYAIVEQVRKALEDRLKEVDWMKSDETRKNALLKMERFGVKVSSMFLDQMYETLT